MTLWRSWPVPAAASAVAVSPSTSTRSAPPKEVSVLYNYDSANKMRFSHENPDVQALYAEYLGKPCGELSHHLLHTDHHGWSLPMAPVFDEDVRLN